MEAPPREKRARAAFFREKEAQRAAKKQRKRAKLTARLAGAKEQDVAPTRCSEADVEVGAVQRVEPFGRGREQRAHALLPLRVRPRLAGTSDRDAMVGLSSEAGRATMWQGYQMLLTESERRARLSPAPGGSLGLIGEGTNGLESSSSEPGKGVWVH